MRKNVSFPDHALLRADDPNNLMVITGLITLDTPLDFDRLTAVLEKSLLPFRRFRQRLVRPTIPFLRPCWEDDPTFNLASHLIRVQLPPPADQKTLQDLISELMSKELDFSRPLWEFYLIDSYGTGSAIVARLHHCLADGIALMQVLLSLASTKTDSSPVSHSQDIDRNILPPHSKPVTFHRSRALFRASQVAGLASAVGSWVLRWPDPPTVFKGPLGMEKRAAWSGPVELKDVKFIGAEFHCTVNDVVLAAVAGAFGQYIAARGGAPEDLCIHGFIPVNLRPIELDGELGNRFGLVLLPLPVGIHDPVERLHRVRRNMGELKSSSHPVAGYGILNFLGAVPSRVEEIAVDFIGTKGTAVITNIPGPQTQLYLAGAPIDTVMAWVPQSGRIALGVSILSYNGKVWMGIASDKGLVPDPETIIALFHAEYAELRSRAQLTQAERKTDLKPLFTLLDEAMKTLDELLAEVGKDDK